MSTPPIPFIHFKKRRSSEQSEQERRRMWQNVSVNQHRKHVKVTLPEAPWMKEKADG